MSRLPPIVFAFTGTSLTTGRLSADWVPRLQNRLRQEPEAKGDVVIYNMGRGSQTSNWGVTNAPLISDLQPTHILFEDFGINDCAIGPVSLSQAAANFDAMVMEWETRIPGVSLTHQTMSPAASTDALRVNLQTYYNQGLAKAAAHGIPSLNHTPNWPAINNTNTYGALSGGAFSVALTSGYAGMPATTMWNRLDKAASIDLSNNDLTASSSSAGVGLIRANAAITANTHIEFYMNNVSGTYPGVGIANLTEPVSGGTGAGTVSILPNGTIYNSGSPIGAGGFTYTTGDTVALEFNPTTKKLAFQKGATRSADIDVSSVTGPYYPVAAVDAVGTSVTATFTQIGTGGDSLHPIWPGVFETYSYPAILAWAKAQMAAYAPWQ